MSRHRTRLRWAWPGAVASRLRLSVEAGINAFKLLLETPVKMGIETQFGAMLTVMPVMAVYMVASKQFIRGIALTGIKG